MFSYPLQTSWGGALAKAENMFKYVFYAIIHGEERELVGASWIVKSTRAGNNNTTK